MTKENDMKNRRRDLRRTWTSDARPNRTDIDETSTEFCRADRGGDHRRRLGVGQQRFGARRAWPVATNRRTDSDLPAFPLGLYFVEHFSPGAYGVHFYRDVSMCVFSATPGWGDALSTGAVYVEVNDLFESPDGVYVVTRNAAGTPTDFPFQLVVHC